jgi:hypothetical protein
VHAEASCPLPDTRRSAPGPALPEAGYPGDVDIIEQAVLRAFALPISSLRSHNRGRAEIAFARQVAIYVAHVLLGLTLTDAARMFGRDRTTASHACRTVEDRRDDRKIDQKLEAIERSLQNWVFPRLHGRDGGSSRPGRLQ